MDNLSEMFYNDKHKVQLHTVCSELLRPFTQLDEQTRQDIICPFPASPALSLSKGFLPTSFSFPTLNLKIRYIYHLFSFSHNKKPQPILLRPPMTDYEEQVSQDQIENCKYRYANSSTSSLQATHSPDPNEKFVSLPFLKNNFRYALCAAM
jgi:hypothetical protein